MSQTLLIELFTEELPPKALNQLGNHLAQSIAEGLEKAQLIDGATEYTAYASPRRLAVQVARVKSEQADQHIVKKGPAVNANEKAIEGFARSCGVEKSSLHIVHDGKQDVYVHEFTQKGQKLAALLGDIVNAAVKKLPIPKVMRWGSSTHTFVRPVHGLVAMHGAEVLPINVLGLDSRNCTLGHRFLSHGEITFAKADDYAAQLAEEGKVIASFADQNGKLMNRFLLVSNLQTQDPSHIIQGNERVLRARLSDAEFFYKQDQKATLESRLPKLASVVYHNKIGSQAERVERLQTIAAYIAGCLNADKAVAERAARLAKADLVTEMVGEFPELQGTMGKYYAQLDGETPEIAAAVEQHYRPRFAGDALPESTIGTAVALADKLETLVGIWGIGLIPTGDKDPYALRRSALGVLRMLMNYDLSIRELLTFVFDSFPKGLLAENTVAEVADFMQARLAVLLQNDYPQDVVAAVLAQRPDRVNNLTAKLQAVVQFKQLPESTALAAANKRVQNLLKKSEGALGNVDAALLQQDEEKALFAAVQELQPKVQAALDAQDFSAALSALAAVKPQVDAFFDGVMVMADDAAVKQNRLNLLNVLSNLLNAVADIALLAE